MRVLSSVVESGIFSCQHTRKLKICSTELAVAIFLSIELFWVSYFELELVSSSEISRFELSELLKFFELYSSLVYTTLSLALLCLLNISQAWLRFVPG